MRCLGMREVSPSSARPRALLERTGVMIPSGEPERPDHIVRCRTSACLRKTFSVSTR